MGYITKSGAVMCIRRSGPNTKLRFVARGRRGQHFGSFLSLSSLEGEQAERLNTH